MVNRKNENRPGICCPECKKWHCYKCADLSADQCLVMKAMERCFWKCRECEEKAPDLKFVLDSIKSIHSELKKGQDELKKGQDDQQKERERVLEGLKVIETVATKIDQIEKVQEAHEEKLSDHTIKLQKGVENHEREKERITAIEERMDKIDAEALNVRQTNAVVREIREIEKREKNIIFCNVPEPEDENAEERKKKDEGKIAEILGELKADNVKPTNVIRVGMKGRYPRKVLVILQSAKECEDILKKGEVTQLANDVFLTRDRTYNQRQEGRLFRAEKEREEREGGGALRGRGRGTGRGPGRPRGGGGRGRGSVRGRGARSTQSTDSRKRRNSDEEGEAKRQRRGETERDSSTHSSSIPPLAAPMAAAPQSQLTPGATPGTESDF